MFNVNFIRSLLVLILFFLGKTLGQFEDEFLASLPEGDPDGVTVNVGGLAITIVENRLIEDDEDNERVNFIAWIKYAATGDEIPEVQSISPSRLEPELSIVKAADDLFYLKLTSELDFEASTKFWIVTLETQIVFSIQAGDINDEYPEFTSTPDNPVRVPEKEFPLVILERFQAADDDFNDVITYSMTDLQNDDTTTPFEINENGQLTLLRELDYRAQSSYRLQVMATDNNGHTSNASVTIIEVIDKPDLPPIWDSFSYRLEITENNAEDEFLYTYRAFDGDYGINSDMLYSLTNVPIDPISGQPYLTINLEDGRLTASAFFDAETAPESFDFQVIATEVQDVEPLEASMTVTLVVIDQNDRGPAFPNGDIAMNFVVQIPENTIGTLPGLDDLTINDADVGTENNQFTATLIVEDDEDLEIWLNDKFKIVPPSGNGGATFALQISPTAVIDFDEDEYWRDTIEFTVRVTDTNAPEKYADGIIFLTVDDLNDNTPEFTGLSNDGVIEFFLTETQTGQIGTIVATDGDISEEFGSNSIKYTWSNNVPSKLHLDEVSGIITTVGNQEVFDAETLPIEVYVVEAADMNGEGTASRSTIAILRLMISDENDEAPIINLPANNIRIPEDITLETHPESLLDFEVTDPDSSARLTVTCVVIGEEETEEWFECVTISGENTPTLSVSVMLRPNTELDFEITSRVDIEITATDSETLDGYVDFTTVILPVNIENVNDQPPIFETPFLIFVYETMQCEEEDTNECEDENERIIYTFRATDADTSPTEFIYDINSIYSPMNDLITIENDGILRRRDGVMIDREASYVGDIDSDMIGFLYYNVTVSNENFEHLFNTIEVEIIIYDINDNVPEFQSAGTEFAVLENLLGELEIQFYATDPDAGKFGTVNYFFDESYNDGEGLDKFSIDRKSGLVSIIEAINREENQVYALRVLARDNDGSTSNSEQASHDISISILDENDNAPTFSSDNFPELDEDDVGVSTILGTVQITDIDLEDHDNSRVEANLQDVTWDCVNCDNDNMNWNDYFEGSLVGDTFTVRSKQSLLTYFGTFYINIYAKDFGVPEQEDDETFELVIRDINDNWPVIVFPVADTKVYINVSLAVGDRLVEWNLNPIDYLQATDEDDTTIGNGQIVYSIGDEGNANELFEIKSDASGRYYLAVLSELTSSHEPILVTIIATDEGTPTPLASEVTMSVTVVPAQNAPPLFQNGETVITFEENKADEVENLEIAVDPDTTDIGNIFEEVICYFIVGGDEFESFVLNQDTNRLSLARPLDREVISSYELLIYAKNDRAGNCRPPVSVPNPQSESILQVTVNVADVIDTKPEFNIPGGSTIISGGIKTYAESGSSTSITLRATDQDLDQVFRFTINEASMNRSHSSLELINSPVFLLSDVNDILINFLPNDAMQGYFNFFVTVHDSGDLFSEAECKIYFTTESHEVEFRFNNDQTVFDEDNKLDQVATIMSEVFGYRCNIDNRRQTTDENGNALAEKTTLEVHFINEELSEPVLAYLINNLRFDNPAQFVNLTTELSAIGLELDLLSYFGDTSGESEILTYILISAVAVLGVALAILSVTCWFNSRRLSLRVRALTASTFGSQEAGLNQIGGEHELPNTNQHAVQGSNPIWTTEPNRPNFDTESVGSGGSVLIGVENDDDFRNYAEGEDQSIGGMSENDYQFDFENTRETANPIFQVGESYTDRDMSLPITRRNPLMQYDD